MCNKTFAHEAGKEVELGGLTASNCNIQVRDIGRISMCNKNTSGGVWAGGPSKCL